MATKLPKVFLYFLGAFFVINLLQSYFTELIYDEAYYWYYAQQMAWGYFDHPPMVALLIKIGSFFFSGELGVRFMSCVLSSGTLIILWLLVPNPRKNSFIPHFFVLVFSMTLMNAYGFFTLPDTPLLFFTALFLYLYKKFIDAPSVPLSIALGIVMAALMYSKYHAVLVIVFVLLSNVKLVFNKYAWLAVVTALLCYTPHFIWLFQNDFVSIKYHISERPNRGYEFGDFTLGFFVNLIALFGFTFPWIYKALFKTKSTDRFTKALLFLIYGVLVFFFISSFNRRIQTQWIIVICIPLIVLVFDYMLQNDNAKKWIFRMGIVNAVLLLYARFALVYEPLSPLVYESHGNKKWVQSLQSQIGNIPVVFENSYRFAPMYAFYSGATTFSLNNIMYRQNQYSIDHSEAKIQHERILYVSKYMKQGDISFRMPKNTVFYGNYIEDFESFRKLRCYIEDETLSLQRKDEVVLKVYNPYTVSIALEKLSFHAAYLNEYKQVNETMPLEMIPIKDNTIDLKARDTTYFRFQLPTPQTENPGYFKVVIAENGLYMGLNGENVKLE